MSDLNDELDDVEVTVLAESENFVVLRTENSDGEELFNIELGSVTLHLFQDEWEELVEIVRAAART